MTTLGVRQKLDLWLFDHLDVRGCEGRGSGCMCLALTQSTSTTSDDIGSVGMETAVAWLDLQRLRYMENLEGRCGMNQSLCGEIQFNDVRFTSA